MLLCGGDENDDGGGGGVGIDCSRNINVGCSE